MAYAFKGLARTMSLGAFERAAQRVGCEPATIKALWRVESAGSGFLPDGSLIRRYEPHHFPGTGFNWRQSLKLSKAKREAMFLDAWRKNPELAARATSWAGHQVMGFNHKESGYSSALAMVTALAQSEDAHLDAFVNLILAWGLGSALRARDWLTIAKRWNGSGQPTVYARRMEAAYRSITGASSPAILRIGARGEAVRRLQAALGVRVDGKFGTETEKAVLTYQKLMGLKPDGMVGANTWAALEAHREAKPIAQPTTNPILTLIEAILRLLQGVQPA